jgi:hypothetical protein
MQPGSIVKIHVPDPDTQALSATRDCRGNHALSEWDRRQDGDPDCSSALDNALSFKHNHISYNKGALTRISQISIQLSLMD